MNLIIVESPTKAKTFSKYVNPKEYQIISSMGHIRDLPVKKLGVIIEKNFEPEYEIITGKEKVVKPIVDLAKKAETIILATDLDREGEAIAFHLHYILLKKIGKKIENKFKRIVFHEITKEALEEALKETRTLNEPLFDAQQARRILDRIVGYKLSPYLWKTFSKSWLSAGRVQSVALRFIVEREKERLAFTKSKFFVIEGLFKHSSQELEAKLLLLKKEKLIFSKEIQLFDGKYEYQQSIITSAESAKTEVARLQKETYIIDSVEEKVAKRSPPPPFTTSTLQQYASNTYSFTAKRTMRIAQSLYELGLITYHRTDSFNVSEKFVNEVRKYIKAEYGQEYLSPQARVYKTKSKSAQEAHEAIRPTNPAKKVADLEKEGLTAEQQKLYEAIYRRSLACQMADAEIIKQKILIVSKVADTFRTENEQIKFPGFLSLYEKTAGAGLMKGLVAKTEVKVKVINSLEKETQLPPRYSEASLIKTLEARGIGRPSTYAPIISLIQERQYVNREGRELFPSELGTSISNVLSDKFNTILDVSFTAKMEDELDEISLGNRKWQDVVKSYYDPLAAQLETAYKGIQKVKVEELTNEKCPECQYPLAIKMSRFGKFYACTNFPKCKYTKSFLQPTDVVCPKCGKGQVVVRFSRQKRRFYACDQYPECDFTSLWLPKSTTKETPLDKKAEENQEEAAA